MRKEIKETSVDSPTQYTLVGEVIRKLLKFKIVKHLCFSLGLKGFNRIGWQVERKGKIVQSGFTYNSRVDKGADLSASLLAGESFNSITTPLPPKYIALSTSELTPAAGDETLTGETSVSGLARAVGAIQSYTGPASLDAAASYIVYKAFTNAGATTTIESSALFDSTGNMFVEANLDSSATLEVDDLLKISWTINL